MKVLIVAGGEKPSKDILELYKKDVNLVIGADKGCSYLIENGITPDYFVGDFDSLPIKDFEKYLNQGSKLIKFDAEKDLTDSDIALNLAIEKGADEIFLMAVTGTRLDHSLANIGLLLKALKNNVRAKIINNNNVVMIINEDIELVNDKNYKYISFLPYGGNVSRLSIFDAKYRLEDYNLECGDSRTISNEFVEDKINIKIEKGNLLVIYSKD